MQLMVTFRITRSKGIYKILCNDYQIGKTAKTMNEILFTFIGLTGQEYIGDIFID